MIKSRICVVTVTYGDRWHLLRKVLSEGLAVQTCPVGSVVIVDNGSMTDLRTAVAGLEVPFHVELAGTGSNTGSAAGYKAGLQAAKALGCDLIWLLDDDNLPAPDALERLLEARTAQGANPLHAFACFRADREKYIRAIAGEDGPDVLRADAFMGVKLGDILRIIRRRMRRSTGPRRKVHHAVRRIGYAIYGGLLFSSELLEKIGLPDESYFLYMDDREFTVRIPLAGGEIFLVADSQVVDIEQSWNVKPGRKALPMMDPGMPRDKVYYTCRNQVAFERKYVVRSYPQYFSNMMFFLASALARGFLQNRSFLPTLTRFRLLLRAVQDGWSGRMGPRGR